MSQEQKEQARRARRIARSQRNRPVLVTNNDAGVALDTEQPALTTTNSSTDGPRASTVEITRETGTRRRLGFFSTIGKSEEGTEKKETDVTQARLARATHKAGKATSTVETPPVSTKAEAKKNTRPASAFKTRYIIGMALYLLAANFLGAYEVQFMRSIHADTILTTFNLFGGKVVISSSTVVFLATLIIILVLLARLDLIPRSLTGASTSRQSKTAQDKTPQSSEPAPRYTPPPARQGVKGSDDKLYQTYRANQRREKKK